MNGLGPILLAVGVIGGHYAYYAWPPGWERSWAQWVGLNLLVVVAVALLLPAASRQRGWRSLGLVAAWVAIIESSECAVCSVWRWGSVPQADLCVEAAGVWPYVVASAVFGALLIGRTKR